MIVTSSSIHCQCFDVIGEHLQENSWDSDDYHNNSYNFEPNLVKLSDDIHNFITEIVDV